MGMDLHGVAPRKTLGEYFRNNCWWWRPLWSFVCDIACKEILTEKQKSNGHYNDGCLITDTQAIEIARRLNHLIECGAVRKFEDERNKEIEALPDEKCDTCDGQGERNDGFVKGICNACHGKGTRRPSATHYPFEESNVAHFAKFCEDSGGFEIW